MSPTEAAGLSTTYDCGRTGTPDLRLLHFNDVYHVEAGSAEPIGGTPRFQTLVNYYRNHPRFAGQPPLLTFFSGDAFNPSLESSVTKGRHMVPFLNQAGTDVACVGNHDLDFGVEQFEHLRNQCKFPWLLANMLDPALGEGVPLANCPKTHMLESNGIKVGVIGLGEREWLDTVNALPPIIYKSASATANELVPGLRAQGADLIVAVTHQREPNDNKLAKKTPTGLIDIILGGHDHFYGHSIVKSTHVLRSGTDFKQLSYIEAWRKTDGSGGWDFSITRRDVVRAIPEDPATVELVAKLTSALKAKLQKPVGYTANPLDARFTTVRRKESNLGNFVCDLMRFHHHAECAMMASGTIRGDQIYPPGPLRVKDILNCFPFEDPVVVLRVKGRALRAALENGVSELPALEGRFPQVSNIQYGYALSAPPGSRIAFVKVGGEDLEDDRLYTLATRGYMARGKDGYTALLTESEGGEAEEIISEENGVLISTILRQYFLSLKVLGTWNRLGPSLHRHWDSVNERWHGPGWMEATSPLASPEEQPKKPIVDGNETPEKISSSFQYESANPRHKDEPGKAADQLSRGDQPDGYDSGSNGSTTSESESTMDSESDSEPEILSRPRNYVTTAARSVEDADHREVVARHFVRKWREKAGLGPDKVQPVDHATNGFSPAWTRAIAPVLEGRIVQIDRKKA
ncbi:5'-nucleotidase [Blastomyces gilchristii SLH14081]|uniref:5'-nucleotidase n=1 Tax=Blastomyces gilchristii (strain SLH14081) TaxID=559298 RepID=A0A179UUN2_BLAGS|nr:5'-nucleotidase [Blastomyces gilchristii SLH14081]OAT10112.1 5'-nucleotidase [Blastomyces gilchristii SLH14081]